MLTSGAFLPVLSSRPVEQKKNGLVVKKEQSVLSSGGGNWSMARRGQGLISVLWTHMGQ